MIPYLTFRCNQLFISIILFIVVSQNLRSQNLEGISKQKPLTINGGMMAQIIFYNANGISADRQPISYILTGSPTIGIYNIITIPLIFTYSEQERLLRQPFNQFGISPNYKWITLHAGYQNLNYSQFTLAGHTILGAGIDLNPGIFRFGFIYGRFNRATGADTSSKALQPYTYANYGYAIKLGLGKGSNFFELSFLKAKDYSTSIRPDSVFRGQVTPAENVTIGMNGQIRFLKYFTYSIEGATSLYTSNLGSKGNMVDSADNLLVKMLGHLITTNSSTAHFNAIQTGIGFQQNPFGLKLQYHRIDPDYKSMGAYFFNSDLENITIAPSLNLFSNKLRLNGSIGFQHDNLNSQNQSTSHRIIGSANFSADLNSHLGFDFSFSDYSDNQQMKTILLKDTFRIAQVSENISFTPRYVFANEKYVHSVILSLNYNLFTTLDNSTNNQEQTKTWNSLLNYQITIIATNLTLNAGLNYTDVMAVGYEEGNEGITLGISKILKKGKLSLGWNGSFLYGINSSSGGLILNQSLNANYKISKQNSFGANVNYINNKSQQIVYSPDYSELTVTLNYRLSF
jgi:hypothetical protein